MSVKLKQNNTSLTFSWLYSTQLFVQNCKKLQFLRDRSACMHTLTQGSWDVEGSSRSSGLFSSHLDKSLEAMAWDTFKLYSLISSSAFKGPGNPFAHSKKLYVFHLTSGIHMPTIAACISLFFLHKTHTTGQNVSLCYAKHTICPLK